ncbi:MAG: hypothetical protein MPW15_19185 [Candidatus Manganitrophus sp.]|nr:hypothetical protein [Candidatus Manganitrophus sp.]
MRAEIIRPTRLSEDLRRILDQANGKGVTIGKIIEILHGRGFDVFSSLSWPFRFARRFRFPASLPPLG